MHLPSNSSREHTKSFLWTLITQCWSSVKIDCPHCEQMECGTVNVQTQMSIETFCQLQYVCMKPELFDWAWHMQNKGRKSRVSFEAAFLLHTLIVNRPKKHSKLCFLWSLGGSSSARRVKAGLSLPWRFFLRVPLKASFVAPDVLCSYLFSLWTGRQKAAGIMMERQNRSDIVAGPHKR